MSESIIDRRGREIGIATAVFFFLLPLLGMDMTTYLTLTIAGVAMGMMIFLVASGMSLIFGLMDVINFAHGVCFAWGAYVAFSVFKYFDNLVASSSLLANFTVFFLAIAAAVIVVGTVGIIMERVLIRRVYGSHLFQILITFGGMVVLRELLRIIWGPNDEVMTVPLKFQGNWNIFDIIILKYPIYAILLGLVVYMLLQLVLKRTKLGKIVRAGVEDADMVQAMGHNIFLDGNTWKNSHHVDKKPLVGDLQAGVVISWGRFRGSFTNVFRTREYYGQSEKDEFGSINLSVLF